MIHSESIKSTEYGSNLTKMSLLSLPKEVLEKGILPYLSWNDLLRLRGVSKQAHNLIQDYVQGHPQLAPEIEIRNYDETGRTFEAFLKMGLSTEKLFLNKGNGDQFYRNNSQEITSFLQNYGSIVKHLRLREFCMYDQTGNERRFLESLVNLQSVKTERLDVQFNPGRENWTPLPGNFQLLKSLSFEELPNPPFLDAIYSLQECIICCKNLDHICLPWIPMVYSQRRHVDTGTGSRENNFIARMFTFLNESIKLGNVPGSEKSLSLKRIDFVNVQDSFEHHEPTCLAWTKLWTTCIVNSVQLANVRTSWIRIAKKMDQNNLEAGELLLSLIYDTDLSCWRQVLETSLPNLEEIHFYNLQESTTMFSQECPRFAWPKLKRLTLTLDLSCEESLESMEQDALYLFRVFLLKDPIPTLEEVCLNFESDIWSMNHQFKLRPLINSSVKRIIVKKWNGLVTTLFPFCQGMQGLEEIVLVNPRIWTNHSFVISEETMSVFLNATCWKQNWSKMQLDLGITSSEMLELIAHLKAVFTNVKAKEDGNEVKLLSKLGLHNLVGHTVMRRTRTLMTFEWMASITVPSVELRAVLGMLLW